MAIVRVDCKNLKDNPQCPHGPTLKFVRSQNGEEQEFFACSTCRDRKDCSFYLAVGDKLSERMTELWTLERKRILPKVNHVALEKRLEEVKSTAARDRLYCHTCEQLDTLERREQHGGHQVQTVISDHMLTHPSEIFKPKEGSKKEAQYFFTTSTTEVILDNLKRVGVTKVLCLGTPRLHEMIQSNKSNKMDSLLLDMDHRYHAFWSREKFVWYNMFNRHIMSSVPGEVESKVKKWLNKFLVGSQGGKLALVMDPPFGGHVEPLSATVDYFTRLANKKLNIQLSVIWVFPYFRERHILEKCPTLKMVDLKVQYGNHKEFQNEGKGRKLGSPVRLFTNLPLKTFVLRKSEGYRFCNPCARWVSAENRHCGKCKTCPSKDGRTYTHCDPCNTCVKPQWKHCFNCSQCLPSPHQCRPQGQGSLSEDNNFEPRHKKLKTTNKKTALKVVEKKNKVKIKPELTMKKPKTVNAELKLKKKKAHEKTNSPKELKKLKGVVSSKKSKLKAKKLRV